MSKRIPDPNITPLELAQLIVYKVDFAMPIGSGNIIKETEKRMPSQEKTGKGNWANRIVSNVRKRTLPTAWSKVPEEIRAAWHAANPSAKFPIWEESFGEFDREYIDEGYVEGALFTKETGFHPNDYSEAQLWLITKAVASEFTKAGNCDEMTSLAMVYLCAYAEKHFTDTTNFCFSIIKGNKNIDHVFIKITIDGESVICDPWLNIAMKIAPDILEKYFQMLKEQGIEKTGVSEADWHDLRGKLMSQDIPENSFTTRNDAMKIAALYEATYERFLNDSIKNRPADTAHPVVFSDQIHALQTKAGSADEPKPTPSSKPPKGV